MNGINFFGIDLKEGHYFNLMDMDEAGKVVLLYELSKVGLLFGTVESYLSGRYEKILFNHTCRGKCFSGTNFTSSCSTTELKAVLCDHHLYIRENKPQKIVQGSIWEGGVGHNYIMSYIADGGDNKYALVNMDTGSTWNGIRTENTVGGMRMEGFKCVKCPEGKGGLRN